MNVHVQNKAVVIWLKTCQLHLESCWTKVVGCSKLTELLNICWPFQTKEKNPISLKYFLPKLILDTESCQMFLRIFLNGLPVSLSLADCTDRWVNSSSRKCFCCSTDFLWNRFQTFSNLSSQTFWGQGCKHFVFCDSQNGQNKLESLFLVRNVIYSPPG